MQEAAQKNTGRIVAIDYLKAFAAIFVILTHALTKSQRLKVAGPFWISMAVPIFMIISGFTNSLSADRSTIFSLKKLYQKQKILADMSRILYPYLIIVSIEYMLGLYLLLFLNTGPFVGFTFLDYILYFLVGGTTPGSYYIPIMIQFILLFPLTYFLYHQSPKLSIVASFMLHFLFDLVANYLPIPTKIYRLLIFRYLGFIILGVALYYSYFKIKKFIKWGNIVSVLYILIYSFGYRLKVFAKWPNTALPTVFWAGTLVLLGLEYLEKPPNNWLSSLLSKTGKASYHIFLVQKILFGFGLNSILYSINSNIVIHVLLAVVICCFLGLFFQKIELKLQRE